MNTRKIKHSIMVLALSIMSGAALVACNEGTEPGDTNVERGEIKDAGEMVGGDDVTRYSDTTDLEEKYYNDSDTAALGDGAYDGKGNGKERDDF
ncbi:hypothetical protein I2I11_00980 [Pontibacter sp. 172403-2]|uniref:hypothetical protein n=1 Tax=Pontibacter rufus TaxID=2791028 RepID=UPI0018AF68D8|nr:hypothetical protein [Pontibacter sp. 172403-2]MBF9251858.1 hypothetical protein [Pontibacter sp. 172403-2]